jgi:hypothetical protein
LCNSEIQLILYTSFKITPFLLCHQIGLFGSTSEQPKQVHSTNSEFFSAKHVELPLLQIPEKLQQGSRSNFFYTSRGAQKPMFQTSYGVGGQLPTNVNSYTPVQNKLKHPDIPRIISSSFYPRRRPLSRTLAPPPERMEATGDPPLNPSFSSSTPPSSSILDSAHAAQRSLTSAAGRAPFNPSAPMTGRGGLAPCEEEEEMPALGNGRGPAPMGAA